MTTFARCPDHGLHGERAECFVCGGPVERVPFIPVDVFVEVARALIMAWEELEQLAVTPVPLPEELLERQHEHEAMLDTLREAPEEWKPRLRGIYEATLARSGSLNGPQWESAPATLLPGVLEGLEAVEELLRRAALVDPGVAEAMRQVHGS